MILWVLASMNVTRSSLFPTAMVLPSGAQEMLIFSPFVGMVAIALVDLVSQIRTVLKIELSIENSDNKT